MKSYTEDDFIKYVKESSSISQVLKKIGLKPAGGNYATAKKRILVLKLDISHFLGQGYLKGRKHNWGKKIPLEDVLVENSTYIHTSKLKSRLIKAGLLEKKCYKCGLKKWLKVDLSLELEHINGNRFDNRIENLTILCPNCHSLTPTYRGRGKKKSKNYQMFSPKPKKKYFCKQCNKEITKKTKTKLCLKCYNKTRINANRHSKEQLGIAAKSK